MAGAEAIGPIIGLASKAAQGGGGKGGGSSSGGVSPQQAALARYTKGQQLLQSQSQMASSGTAHSTGSTQMAGGAEFGEAYQLAQMSDANQTAAFNTAQQQQSALQSIANQAGGQGTGGFSAGANSGTGTASTPTSV